MVIMYEVVNRASNHLFSESILFFRNKNFNVILLLLDDQWYAY